MRKRFIEESSRLGNIDLCARDLLNVVELGNIITEEASVLQISCI